MLAASSFTLQQTFSRRVVKIRELKVARFTTPTLARRRGRQPSTSAL